MPYAALNTLVHTEFLAVSQQARTAVVHFLQSQNRRFRELADLLVSDMCQPEPEVPAEVSNLFLKTLVDRLPKLQFRDEAAEDFVVLKTKLMSFRPAFVNALDESLSGDFGDLKYSTKMLLEHTPGKDYEKEKRLVFRSLIRGLGSTNHTVRRRSESCMKRLGFKGDSWAELPQYMADEVLTLQNSETKHVAQAASRILQKYIADGKVKLV